MKIKKAKTNTIKIKTTKKQFRYTMQTRRIREDHKKLKKSLEAKEASKKTIIQMIKIFQVLKLIIKSKIKIRIQI
jgi:hypothetical protein